MHILQRWHLLTHSVRVSTRARARAAFRSKLYIFERERNRPVAVCWRVCVCVYVCVHICARASCRSESQLRRCQLARRPRWQHGSFQHARLSDRATCLSAETRETETRRHRDMETERGGIPLVRKKDKGAERRMDSLSYPQDAAMVDPSRSVGAQESEKKRLDHLNV